MLNLLFHYECDRTPMPLLHHFALDDPGVINQSIKVICNARNVVHKLESEARELESEYVVVENRQLTYY